MCSTTVLERCGRAVRWALDMVDLAADPLAPGEHEAEVDHDHKHASKQARTLDKDEAGDLGHADTADQARRDAAAGVDESRGPGCFATS